MLSTQTIWSQKLLLPAFLLTAVFASHHVASLVSKLLGPRRGRYLLLENGKRVRIVVKGKPILVDKTTSGEKGVVVVFVAGMGVNSSCFAPVQRKLKRLVPDLTTVAYDRAGLGWSTPDDASGIRTLSDLAEELYNVLEALDLVSNLGGRSVVLVGHSWGGAIVEMLCYIHPELAPHGLILAEPTPTRAFSAIPPLKARLAQIQNLHRTFKRLAMLGFGRFLIGPLFFSAMTFAYPRFGREMNLVDRAEFVHQQVYAPNCRAAMAEARGAPLGCEELENAKADLEKGVAKARSVIVIQGEKAALPERITGMKEEDFLKTVLEERSGSGRRLCNGVWSGSWIDPGADHMDVVVGDQLVEAVQLAIQ